MTPGPPRREAAHMSGRFVYRLAKVLEGAGLLAILIGLLLAMAGVPGKVPTASVVASVAEPQEFVTVKVMELLVALA